MAAGKVPLPQWWVGIGKLAELVAPAIYECVMAAQPIPGTERIIEGTSKGATIKCVMDAVLSDGSEASDSSTITIGNTPPTVTVSIKKPASVNETLVCNGVVEDIDEDPITVNWEFSEGYFKSDVSRRTLRSGETFEATASDGEISGSPSQDFVIISG